MLYPIMNSKRMVMDLSGIWDFIMDDGTGFEQRIYERPLENAMSMPVPASYNDLKEMRELRDFCGWVFYQKMIAIPELIENENRVFLRCDAVTHHAKIYLNGELIGEHKGGFLPFEVNLNGKMKTGNNLLTVAVENRIDNTTLPVGRDNDITGMVFHDGKRRNYPNFDFFNYAGITRPIRICTTPLKEWIEDISISNRIEGKNASLEYEIEIKNNSGSIKKADIEQDKCLVTVCDQEGNVVASSEGKTYDPAEGVKTFEHHKDVIKDMISRDKNYACVVMWSIANEANTHIKGAYEYFAPLVELAKKTDPQYRMCTLVGVNSNTDPEGDVISKLSDVFCLNRYYGWYDGGPDLDYSEQALREELTKWEKIGKPLIITEYGADTVMGLHDTTSVMFTEEYQVDYYKMNNKVFDSFDFVIGEQAWNFADFATGQGTVRVQGNKKGLFTRDRRPKLAAHYFRERWAGISDFKETENE